MGKKSFAELVSASLSRKPRPAPAGLTVPMLYHLTFKASRKDLKDKEFSIKLWREIGVRVLQTKCAKNHQPSIPQLQST